MYLLVTRKTPEIVRIKADELSSRDLFYLNVIHKTCQEDFVICDSQKEKILVNKSLDFAENIIPLIDQIMDREYLDDGTTEGLFDVFSSLAGRKATDTLFYIWRKWRGERRKIETKENAEKILLRVKKGRLKKHLKDRKEVAGEIFSIGFGTYSNKPKTDWQKGVENVFLYGYLSCLEDMEDQHMEGEDIWEA